MTPEQMERELERAAAILQDVLPIGRVKHIGLREVADGVQYLVDVIRAGNIDDLDDMRNAVNENAWSG